MNIENFKMELNKELKTLSAHEVIDLINGLIDKLPSDYYEYIICKIKNFKGEQNNIDEDILKKYNEILTKYEEIENGEICFKGYSYETGTYSYYDADIDYVYYPTHELEEVFADTYELIKKLVLYREYGRVITLFESIINTNYTCEEVGNPDYDNSDEIYDTFEVDFDMAKNNLGIDLNKACLYAIYSLIMSNKSNKYDKIFDYIKICPNVNIKDVLKIGIEKIDNFNEIYSEWIKYNENK